MQGLISGFSQVIQLGLIISAVMLSLALLSLPIKIVRRNKVLRERGKFVVFAGGIKFSDYKEVEEEYKGISFSNYAYNKPTLVKSHDIGRLRMFEDTVVKFIKPEHIQNISKKYGIKKESIYCIVDKHIDSTVLDLVDPKVNIVLVEDETHEELRSKVEQKFKNIRTVKNRYDLAPLLRVTLLR